MTVERRREIQVIKDMGSAAVFCGIVIVGLLWVAAMWESSLVCGSAEIRRENAISDPCGAAVLAGALRASNGK